MSQKLITVKTIAQFKELEAYLADKTYVAYDTETTGLIRGSRIIGFSLCADTEVAYYVILCYWDTNNKRLVDLETTTYAKQFIQGLVSKSLIMHNAIFDCNLTNQNYQVDLMPSVHTDTMILAHILDENRRVGLKELGLQIFGEDAVAEMIDMRRSIHSNGGMITKDCYELYKADAELIALYGAKDALLTLKLFYEMVPQLYEEGLDKFFYDEESMPLLRTATYDLNTVGLRIDPVKLKKIQGELEAECLEAKGFIYKEIDTHIKKKYPGTSPRTTFNINSSQQLSWLLFFELGNVFYTLTKEGRKLCKALELKMPYSNAAKRDFLVISRRRKGQIWEESKINLKTKKLARPKKVKDAWNYIECGKESLEKLGKKYKWVEKLLEYKKAQKILNTYVIGIQSRAQYSTIYPSFLQHGTTSGRYSSRDPNFQNLPRGDKRVKSCIISRPGCVFVGADQEQMEPRTFASYSQDKRLLDCFKDGANDFYSVIGCPIFGKDDLGLALDKESPNSFAKKFPDLRQISKEDVTLATVYGTTAFQMSRSIDKSQEEAQDIIDAYFKRFPKVHKFMMDSHAEVKSTGVVYNHFGRPRRLSAAKRIPTLFGDTPHGELKYEWRKFLNLAVNHKIQSTCASIMNRSAIMVKMRTYEYAKNDPRWLNVRIVLQVHDELVLEGPEALADDMCDLLKDCMENAVTLPGVKFIAKPKKAHNIADLK